MRTNPDGTIIQQREHKEKPEPDNRFAVEMEDWDPDTKRRNVVMVRASNQESLNAMVKARIAKGWRLKG